ncbi:unnamed protein product [Oppiella nova]|uniref:Uncharacterized protein n=1 Tax=Oppiella nova TaxID=334625 RepID=A0A7R9LDJ5_9ACAR|nr:unnamed protein product [Oppiella nova]CAG2162561.1 unnamed protein product [Oppiella nova]
MYKELNLCLIIIIAAFKGYRSECKITEEQLDNCFHDAMFLGNLDSIIPSNEDEMSHHCSTINGGVNCARDYSASCLTGFPQQVTEMVLTNMGHHMESRCNKPSERAEFLENVKCFLPKEKMKPLHVCGDKHTKFMEIASKMSKEDAHLAFMCCAYQVFKHCILTNTIQICSEGHAQYWDEIFEEVASEAVTFACSDFDSVDKCAAKLKPEDWAKIKTIDQATDPAVWAHNMRTPIKFMLEMINKFHMDS